MATKIKVKQLRNAAGNEFFQRLDSTGVYDRDVISAEAFKRNPDLYEVVESSATESAILAERVNCNEGVTRKKRVKFDPSTDRVHAARYAKGMAAHNIRVAEAKRRNVPLEVVVKESEQETFRKRVADGFRSLGLSDEEAEIASEQNRDSLQDAWDIILGPERAKIARNL